MAGPTPPSGNWSGQPGQPGPGQPAAPGGFQLKPVEAGPAPGIAYADLGMRIGAYIIDSIILSIVFGILASVIYGVFIGAFFTGGFFLPFLLVIVMGVLFFAGSAIYFIYTWTTMRSSPGQKMLGLETVNAGNGATLTQPQAIRRWLFLFGVQAIVTTIQLSTTALVWSIGILATLAPLLSLVGLAYAIYLLYTTSQSSKRQGFHDVQAGTVVIKRVA